MSWPPAQQLTALTANVFNPPRGDQGWAEEEARSPRLADCKAHFSIPVDTVLIGCDQGARNKGSSTPRKLLPALSVSMRHEGHPILLLSPSLCAHSARC